MDNIVKKTKETFLSWQFIKFIIIGVINTLSTTIFASLFPKSINANIAFILGYLMGTIISYVLNSIFTFKEKFAISKYIKFFISTIPNYLVQQVSVIVIYNMLGMNRYIAYLLAAIIGVPVTFILLKVFAFKKNN